MPSRSNLQKMKVSELKQMAKESGLKGYSKMNKRELVRLLEGRDVSAEGGFVEVPGGVGEVYELRPDRSSSYPATDEEDMWLIRSGLARLLQIEDASQYVVSYFDNPDGLQVALKWITNSCKEAEYGDPVVMHLEDGTEDKLYRGRDEIAEGERAYKKAAKLMYRGAARKENGAKKKDLDMMAEGDKMFYEGRRLMEEAEKVMEGGRRVVDGAKMEFINANRPSRIGGPKKGKRFYISLAGLSFGGVGHWAGWIFDKDKNSASIYDSMQTCSPFDGEFLSVYSVWFAAYLEAALPEGASVEVHGCSTCRIEPIRLGPRQPTGGFVPYLSEYARSYNYGGGTPDNIRWENIPPIELGGAGPHEAVYSYDSQHHFCFMEALLFISEILVRECLGETFSSDQEPLFQIKRFIWALVHSIPVKEQRRRGDGTSIFPKKIDRTYFDKYFRYVFDPETLKERCVMRCEKNFDYDQRPFSGLVKVLEFTYSGS